MFLKSETRLNVKMNQEMHFKNFPQPATPTPLSAANSIRSFINAAPKAVKDPNKSLEHNSTFSSLSICGKQVCRKDYKYCLKYGQMVRS